MENGSDRCTEFYETSSILFVFMQHCGGGGICFMLSSISCVCVCVCVYVCEIDVVMYFS